MTKSEYLKLVKEIQKYDRYYYSEAKPLISDYEYDQLYKKLESIENEHPDWITEDSPTQRVGEALTKGFKQIQHVSPMLSLDNTYSREEVEAFIKRVHKLLEKKSVPFCTELKMDGVAIAVRYEKGKYVQAVTRGDGRKGDDITANLKTSPLLPLELSGKKIPNVLELRGEAYLTHKIFHHLNKMKEQEGEELWANPRNAAAGSLKLLDPREVVKRHLSVVFYGLGLEDDALVDTQYEVHEYLKHLGLPIFEKEHRALCHTIDEIFHFADKIEKQRPRLPFDIDGIVIKVDQLRLHGDLGMTGKSPRWAVAYKFAPEQAETKVKKIYVQVGRTGTLTPVAEFEPVFLAGSTISRASLHNEEEVERKDIREGDTVIIEKAGDVIPQVVSVILKKRPRSSHSWKSPKTCPSCGTHVVKVPGEVAVRCPNVKGCKEQLIRRLTYFASRDAMDIEHLGEKVAEQLVEKGLIAKLSDIYALDEDKLSHLEGFKEKSISNLLHSIDKSKKASLARFIMALGIRYVGEETAELLSNAAGDIKTLSEMSEDELLQIEGIGDKMAKAIVVYFEEKTHRDEIKALLHLGVKPHAEKLHIQKGHAFNGKTFVLTGTLSSFTRSEATALIKERGGKVAGSVSKNTDFVLVGEDPGSKLDKAHELKIKILTEDQFKKML